VQLRRFPARRPHGFNATFVRPSSLSLQVLHHLWSAIPRGPDKRIDRFGARYMELCRYDRRERQARFSANRRRSPAFRR
jgi:hypothetical protein